MRIVFGLAVFPLLMALVSADVWSDLKTCRSDVAGLKTDLDQCQDAKANCQAQNTQCSNAIAQAQKEAYCWECAYKEVQACMDATTGSCSNVYAVCYPNALKIREKCLTIPGYTCGSHFRSSRYRFQLNERD
ncbi:unnamed protein product [Mortierella alpina]